MSPAAAAKAAELQAAERSGSVARGAANAAALEPFVGGFGHLAFALAAERFRLAAETFAHMAGAAADLAVAFRTAGAPHR